MSKSIGSGRSLLTCFESTRAASSQDLSLLSLFLAGPSRSVSLSAERARVRHLEDRLLRVEVCDNEREELDAVDVRVEGTEKSCAEARAREQRERGVSNQGRSCTRAGGPGGADGGRPPASVDNTRRGPMGAWRRRARLKYPWRPRTICWALQAEHIVGRWIHAVRPSASESAGSVE